MATIKLKGDLHIELIGLGLKPGDEVNATKCQISKVGVMHFTVYKNGWPCECSVWPDNYDIIKE